jgi:intein/homing endonuclease
LKVIISGYVWMPMDEFSSRQLINIRKQLTIHPRKTTDIATKEAPPPIHLFKEDYDRKLIGVPREYYRNNSKGEHEEILKVSQGEPMQELETKWTAEGPYVEQETALKVLQASIEGKAWGGMLLNANCAFGKTYTGLELVRRIGRRTIILVHKDFLLHQWENRILSVMPDARVGIIKQKRCEYDFIKGVGEPDFVIALMQSLAKDDGKGGRYPKEMYEVFGNVTGDEIHRVGAPTFSDLVARFPAAWRLGLSATLKRADGAQGVFFQHISEPTYKSKTKGRKFSVRRLYTDTILRPISRGSYYVSTDDLNSAQVDTQLASDEFRSKAIVDDLLGAVRAGKKIMVVSTRLAQLKFMSEKMGEAIFDMDLPWAPTIDFYTGSWFTGEVWDKWVKNKKGKVLHRKGDPKFAKRKQHELDKAEEAQIIFCTYQECVSGDSFVIDVDDGQPLTVRDLANMDLSANKRILSYDEEKRFFEPVRVKKAWKTGCKPVLKITYGRTAKSVRNFSVTHSHMVLSQRGWVRADDLVQGDWVKIPMSFDSDRVDSDVSPDDALLLGYLIGDGSTAYMKNGTACFHNIDDEIVKTVDSLLEKHSAFLKEKDCKSYYINLGGRKGTKRKSPFRKLIEKHLLDGKRAWEKTLSDDLLWCSKESAAALIAGLVASDGNVSKKKLNVSHSSSSKVLAYQMQLLLLRLGIISVVVKIKPNKKARRRAYWKVVIDGKKWVTIFSDKIGKYLPACKKDKLDRLLSLPRSNGEQGIATRVPEEMWVHAMRVWRSTGMEQKDLYAHWGKSNIPIGVKVHRNGVNRDMLEFIAEETSNSTLSEWSSDEAGWDRIMSISEEEEMDVYDLTMEKNSNFVCDGVVVHNCQEGLDIPAVNVISFAIPKGDIEQVAGRGRRWCMPEYEKCRRLCSWKAGICKGKEEPIILDVIDSKIARLKSRERARNRFYKSCGVE